MIDHGFNSVVWDNSPQTIFHSIIMLQHTMLVKHLSGIKFLLLPLWYYSAITKPTSLAIGKGK